MVQFLLHFSHCIPTQKIFAFHGFSQMLLITHHQYLHNCCNPMYLEIHLCQNTLTISARRSQLGSFLIMPAYQTEFPSSEQIPEIAQSHREV